MDSSSAVSLDQEVASERLIRFDSPSDFRARQRFREQLRPSEYGLVKPIGGYSFDRSHFTICGLQNCCRPHGLGLVVLLKHLTEGTEVETNIGHCCGHTKYSLEWDVLELQLQRSKREWAIKDLAAKVLKERDERLAAAKSLRARVVAARATIAPVRDLLEADRALHRVFFECAKLDGRMVYHRPLNPDERQLYPGQKTLPIAFGTLQGFAALSRDGMVESELKEKVIAKLWDWQELDLSKARRSKLEEINADMRQFDDVMRRATDFVEHAQQLISPSNWRGLRDYCIAAGAGISSKSKVKLTALAGEPPRAY